MAYLIADLKAVVTDPSPLFQTVMVLGATAVDDGGGGVYHWNAASTDAGDDGEWVVPTDNPTTGRWQRISRNVEAYQALASNLTAIAGLTSAADTIAYFTGSGTAAIATLTTFARGLLDDASDTAAHLTLNLGTMATQASSNVTISGGSVTNITDLAIADGGTGASTAANAFTALKQAATTTATGVVELATDGETGATVVVTGSDGRLTLAGTALQAGDVDDTPVDAAVTAPVSSNWAFDHGASTSAHGGPYNLYVHPNHTGDVTSVADGATTIATGVVTNAKLANVATATIKGRTTAATGVPEDLTTAQTRTLLNVDEIGTARPPSSHDHAANQLAQANTHTSPDTDVGTTSLHHTLGTGANQASAGTHTHDAAYISIVTTPTTGNFPVLTAGGELNNSTYSNATFATAAQGTLAGTALQAADVDDTPVNGVTTAPVSSNWAFDHAADNTAHGGQVTLAGTPTYITIANQVITRAAVSLSTDVTGTLPLASVATRTVVTESGAAHTNAAGDRDKWIRFTGASAKTFTISSGVATATDVWAFFNANAAGPLNIASSGMTLTGNLIFAPLKGGLIYFTSSSAADVVGGSAT